MQYILQPKPLTRELFKPFGNVIETEGARRFSINNCATERFHDLADIDIGNDEGAGVLFSIAQCKNVTRLPLPIRFVERHRLSSQIFYPLFNEPMIMVVAPQGNKVAPQSLHAFITNGKQGINYHRGIWHVPLIALQPNQQFIIVDRDGPGENCEEFHFNATDELILQGPA